MNRELFPDSCSFPSYTERVEASEIVEADSGLTGVEKELTLRFASDGEYATVHSEIPSTVRRLLKHEAFGIETVRVSGDNGSGMSVSWEQWQTDGSSITGVKGYVPIGLLKIRKSPRSKNYAGLVVSDYDPAEATKRGESL